jgi:hypothetical protein
MDERWHDSWCATTRGQRCNCTASDEVQKALRQIEAGDFEDVTDEDNLK